MRYLAIILLLLAGAARSEWDLSKPKKSPRSKRARADARELWEAARPICELVAEQIKAEEEAARIAEADKRAEEEAKKRGREYRPYERKVDEAEVKAAAERAEKLTPEAITEAVEKLELAALKYERALDLEWHKDANDELCAVIKAWFQTYPRLPAPAEAADEKERKRAEAAERKERSALLSSARKMIMDYGAARRVGNQYHHCTVCEGRRELFNPHTRKRSPCTACRKLGQMPDLDGIVKARWMFHSPLYRADTRRALEVSRVMRRAIVDPPRLAPFIRSVAIRGSPEFHGTWIRIHAREKFHTDLEGKRNDQRDVTYDVYRVGKVWYLYHQRYDNELVDIPPEPEPKEDEDD